MKKKMTKKDRIYLASIYNAEGKEKLYSELREKYAIRNPSQAFLCMKKASYLLYDETQDRFMVKDFEENEETIFLDLDSLCARKEKKSNSKPINKEERPTYKSMDVIIQELIGERLVTLSQYISLDTTEKVLRLDETSLKKDGYDLILY